MQQTALGAIRFGYGLGRGDPPRGAAEILDSLTLPDRAAQAFPMLTQPEASALIVEQIELRRAAKDGGEDAAAARDASMAGIRDHQRDTMTFRIARILDSQSPFLERLVSFWFDHFTARATSNLNALLIQPYLNETLRAHATGRFAVMLKAVIQSPLMIYYLDQAASTGPNSPVGKKRHRGLNENLARELLELHTLGVGGGYTQADVRQLAELLTGVTYSHKKGVYFRAVVSEPGAETVLGTSYGGDGHESLDEVLAFLDDLAVHPDTAAHIARKLAVHFVSDTPPEALVAALTRAWSASGGDLMAVYAVLLDRPEAWTPDLAKVKQPFDFIVSGLTALNMSGDAYVALGPKVRRQTVDIPMRSMGQRFAVAPGPDGWPEEAEAWITPAGLATRIRWSSFAPIRLVPDKKLPDPRVLLDTALADMAPERLRRAVAGAESQRQGVALVFSSPEFNRR